MTNDTKKSTRIHCSIARSITLMLGEEIAFGPGKADLLDAIHDTGSISAAGKKLGMSYRRAWMLVAVMNRCFNEPLVTAAKGGAHGGGAQLRISVVTLWEIIESYKLKYLHSPKNILQSSNRYCGKASWHRTIKLINFHRRLAAHCS
jgi:molybdate transport system regulatory protein